MWLRQTPTFQARIACKPCQPGRYRTTAEHREPGCFVQPTCNIGATISEGSATRTRVCGTPPANAQASVQTRPGLGSGAIAGIVAAGIVALLGAGYAAWRHQRGRRDSRPGAQTPEGEFAALIKKQAVATFILRYPQLIQTGTKTLEEFEEDLAALEVPRSTVSLGHELGRGQSGFVLKSVITPRHSTREKSAAARPVAAKLSAIETGMVDHEARAQREEALLVEGLVLRGLRHPAILDLVAIVSDLRSTVGTRRTPALLSAVLKPAGGGGDGRAACCCCQTQRWLQATTR